MSVSNKSPRFISGNIEHSQVQLHYHQVQNQNHDRFNKLPQPRQQVLAFAVNLRDVSDGKLKVGVALNATSENFDRKKGRNIAIGRAFAPKLNTKGQYLISGAEVLEERKRTDGSTRTEVNWDKLENAIFEQLKLQNPLAPYNENLNSTVLSILSVS